MLKCGLSRSNSPILLKTCETKLKITSDPNSVAMYARIKPMVTREINRTLYPRCTKHFKTSFGLLRLEKTFNDSENVHKSYEVTYST